jgi:hypothetical protein
MTGFPTHLANAELVKRIGIATSKVGDQKFCLDGSTD